MKCLLQRVKESSVTVENEVVGAIQQGILILAGLEKGDTVAQVDRMIERVLSYRIFPDAEGKMNCSVSDIGGELLVVSQFTLAADTKKGTRPSFSSAAHPDLATELFEHYLLGLRGSGLRVETGVFGADMQVALVNDGPVTFLLET